MGGASTKNFFHPSKWTTGGTILSPSKPKVAEPPPPPDEVAAMIQEFSRSATERRIKQSKGTASFLSLDPVETYRAPGSKSTTGA